ncbi:hypothetical protein PF005_g7984 [Phytophthora fragariae]|uniref:Uncharacterized protein n=1 Tax=Phytophthora fragariae TaxID=53985 RepID=A0A6A4DYX3_9STRA|nr:hypothetical protein PF003_g37244 [Phytophthora fragariae]KAE9100808.1 hypothetical protein PF010_g14672 [Phytophthora fragariae]KAE9219144.1 hypothetical protein PF005_g7984 [Phytophthora fragariae]KAE9227967.1 hypothetical protein PF004_g11200 [Phytophthora fragariae]KAE9249832.1 hypothetical protein PF002_g5085 [Phytophthora fragariae]
MQSRSNPEASSSAEPSAHQLHPAVFLPTPDTYSWTLPNDKGVLPPAAIRNLRAADFPPPTHRTRGDVQPAAVHSLAVHRLYPYLLSPTGQDCTPIYGCDYLTASSITTPRQFLARRTVPASGALG